MYLLEGSFRLLHSLRAQHEAVLVGINTILIDNPRLNVRNPLPPSSSTLPTTEEEEEENNDINSDSKNSDKKSSVVEDSPPRAIVLDSSLKIAKYLDTITLYRPIICTCIEEESEVYQQVQIELEKRGGSLLRCPKNQQNQIQVRSCLQLLHQKFQIRSILVEGGAHVLQQFFASNLVRQVLVSVQPCFLGGYRSMVSQLRNPLALTNVHVGTVEGNILIYGTMDDNKDSDQEEGESEVQEECVDIECRFDRTSKLTLIS